MFSFTNSQSIGIYIDYSNLFHAKYTLGRDYDIQNFLDVIDQNRNVSQVSFYGAYDKNNIHQFNRIQRLKKRGVCIPPELLEALKTVSPTDIIQLEQRVQAALQGTVTTLSLPNILINLKNRNKYETFKTLLHRKTEEKTGLLNYLQSLH
jgi:hypothetical protein